MSTDGSGYLVVMIVVIIVGGVGVMWVVGWCFDQAVRADQLLTKGMFAMASAAILYFAYYAV